MLVFCILLALSIVSYVAVLVLLPRMLKLKSYPSCSAFTFLLVISAIATSLTYSFLRNGGADIPILIYLSYVEMTIALVFVVMRNADHFHAQALCQIGLARIRA